MINANINKTLNIILPNTNRALKEVLEHSSPEVLETLSKGKDLKSILDTLFSQSAQNPKQDSVLLELLKNNPTLKELGNVNKSLTDLLALLKNEKESLPLQKQLQNFLSSIKDISEKTLQNRVENSGLFLENKLKNSQLPKERLSELLSNDLKAIILKTQDEITNSSLPNRQELLKQLERLSLQIDYHQLVSHLSNATSLYIPYSWDALEDGELTLKKLKDGKFFTDIELQLKEYGKIKLRLGLFESNQLNINISTQSSELKTLLKENLSTLRKQLTEIGITPKEIRFIDEDINNNSYTQSTQDIALGFEIKA